MIDTMKEPLRSWLLHGIGHAGTMRPADVLNYIEEQLTSAERHEAQQFLDWLMKCGLTVGHGTIDLRWHEFKNRITPMSKDEAYKWALKQAGM